MIKKQLDIVVPVYNEGESILNMIRAFNQVVLSSHIILICYENVNVNTISCFKKNLINQENIFFIEN